MKYIIFLVFAIIAIGIVLFVLNSDKKYKDLFLYSKRIKAEYKRLILKNQNLLKIIKENDILLNKGGSSVNDGRWVESERFLSELNRVKNEKNEIVLNYENLINKFKDNLALEVKKQEDCKVSFSLEYGKLLEKFNKLNIENKELYKKYLDLVNFIDIGRNENDFSRSMSGCDEEYDKIEFKSIQFEAVIEAFSKYGINSIWHMSHRKNINSICKKGILNHSDAHDIYDIADISNHEVQFLRKRRDPVYSHPIHDYAPFYINIRNPMLYVNKDFQHEICIVEVCLNALVENIYLISDGNAASQNTNFFNSINELDSLPWDVLHSDFWHDKFDGKRKRCSEVLIYPSVLPEHIKAIHCYSIETKDYLQNCGKPVFLTKSLYF